jgi:hypothetical protein
MFKWEFLSAGLVKGFADILQFANPFLLSHLITFVSLPPGDAHLWHGLSIAFAMFACSEIRSFVLLPPTFTPLSPSNFPLFPNPVFVSTNTSLSCSEWATAFRRH